MELLDVLTEFFSQQEDTPISDCFKTKVRTGTPLATKALMNLSQSSLRRDPFSENVKLETKYKSIKVKSY